jgi:hypothetical protein
MQHQVTRHHLPAQAPQQTQRKAPSRSSQSLPLRNVANCQGTITIRERHR